MGFRACSYLVDSAAYWLDTIKLTDWSTLKYALIQRFSESSEVIANKLHKCKQAPSEDVSQYADRFQSLAARLSLLQSPLPSLLQLHLFIEGLHASLRAPLIEHQPSTLMEAIRFAEYLEVQRLTPCQHDPHRRHRQHYRSSTQHPSTIPRQKDLLRYTPRPRLHPVQDSPSYAYDRAEAHKARRLKEIQQELTHLQIQLASAQEEAPFQVYTGEMLHESEDAWSNMSEEHASLSLQEHDVWQDLDAEDTHDILTSTLIDRTQLSDLTLPEVLSNTDVVFGDSHLLFMTSDDESTVPDAVACSAPAPAIIPSSSVQLHECMLQPSIHPQQDSLLVHSEASEADAIDKASCYPGQMTEEADPDTLDHAAVSNSAGSTLSSGLDCLPQPVAKPATPLKSFHINCTLPLLADNDKVGHSCSSDVIDFAPKVIYSNACIESSIATHTCRGMHAVYPQVYDTSWVPASVHKPLDHAQKLSAVGVVRSHVSPFPIIWQELHVVQSTVCKHIIAPDRDLNTLPWRDKDPLLHSRHKDKHDSMSALCHHVTRPHTDMLQSAYQALPLSQEMPSAIIQAEKVLLPRHIYLNEAPAILFTGLTPLTKLPFRCGIRRVKPRMHRPTISSIIHTKPSASLWS